MGKTIDDTRSEVGRGIEAAMAAPHLLKGQNLEDWGRRLGTLASFSRASK